MEWCRRGRGVLIDMITGQCLFGDIRFEYRGELGHASYCHCSDCRRHTGSAFNTVVAVSETGFKLTGGKPAEYTTQGESGRGITRHFCSRCGSPVFGSSPSHPGRIYIKAGALDNPENIQVSHQSWFSSAVPWAFISADLRAFEKGSVGASDSLEFSK